MNEQAIETWAKSLLEAKGKIPFWQRAALKAFEKNTLENPLFHLFALDLLQQALEEAACLYLPRWVDLFFHSLELEKSLIEAVEVITSSIEAWAVHQPCLVYEAGWVYLRSYWKLEEKLADQFHFFSTLHQPPLSSEKELEPFLSPLNAQQKQAVLKSLRSPFFIVAGGPGTGKTFTAAAICQSLIHALAKQRSKPTCDIRIALIAPTGKASIRLYESMMRSPWKSAFLSQDFSTMTLHSYLTGNFKEGVYEALSNPAPYEIILVDEASMIDATRLQALFSSVHPSTHLILMGDPDQLPPVEGPGLFASMVLASSESTCFFLKTPVRAQNQALVEAARAIREGDLEGWQRLVATCQEVKNHLLDPPYGLKIGNKSGPIPLVSDWMQQVDHLLQSQRMKAKQQASKAILELLSELSHEVILCVSKSGFWSTGAINAKIFQQVRALALRERWTHLCIPVMATVNQRDLERMNGQMGLVRLSFQEFYKAQTLDRALAIAKEVHFSDSGKRAFVTLPSIRLEKMEPAWAISVHKSQGSEFDHVSLLVNERALLFGRSLLYTACTRAKKTLTVYSYGSTLSELFKLQQAQSTAMYQRLQARVCQKR